MRASLRSCAQCFRTRRCAPPVAQRANFFNWNQYRVFFQRGGSSVSGGFFLVMTTTSGSGAKFEANFNKSMARGTITNHRIFASVIAGFLGEALTRWTQIYLTPYNRICQMSDNLISSNWIFRADTTRALNFQTSRKIRKASTR